MDTKRSALHLNQIFNKLAYEDRKTKIICTLG